MNYDNWLVSPWETMEAEAALTEGREARAAARRQARIDENVEYILGNFECRAECVAETDPEVFLLAVNEAVKNADPAIITEALRPAAIRLAEAEEMESAQARCFGPDRDDEGDE